MSGNVVVNDAAWRRIYNLVTRSKETSVRIGVFDGEMAEIAAIHEYGAPGANIPARPFMRQALEKNRPQLVSLQATIAKALIEGRIDALRAAQILGVWGVGVMKASIVDGSFAPLAESTVKAKGSDQPLIESGQLRRSIAFRVGG